MVPVVVDPIWAGDGRLVALGGDRRAGTALPDALAEGMAGIAPVAHHPLRHARQAVEVQLAGQTRAAMRLTRPPTPKPDEEITVLRMPVDAAVELGLS